MYVYTRLDTGKIFIKLLLHVVLARRFCLKATLPKTVLHANSAFDIRSSLRGPYGLHYVENDGGTLIRYFFVRRTSPYSFASLSGINYTYEVFNVYISPGGNRILLAFPDV